jgi:hypothetical protein
MDEKFHENVFGRGVRLAGALVARAAPAAHATISWDFIEQSIPVCTAGNFVTGVGWVCAEPSSPSPYVLASLTLPGPDSSGSASWDGVPAPVLSGDPFVYQLTVYGLGSGSVSTGDPTGDGSAWSHGYANGGPYMCRGGSWITISRGTRSAGLFNLSGSIT